MGQAEYNMNAAQRHHVLRTAAGWRRGVRAGEKGAFLRKRARVTERRRRRRPTDLRLFGPPSEGGSD